MSRPQLYVFAGPNGAGKSSLSASLVPPGTPIFDGDLEYLKLKKFFYDLDDVLIRASVNDNSFPEWKSSAIATGKDAAFETNFRSAKVMDSVKEFADAGYVPRLIFIGLRSISESAERVSARVMHGGHFVSPEDIQNNYQQSLVNLNLFYDAFSSVHIFQNSQPIGKQIQLTPLLTIEANQIIEQADELPEWVIQFLKNIKP